MTDDVVIRNILKFVRQLDGVENDELVFKAAVAHRWLDVKGIPTPDGRRLIDSFATLEQIGRPAN